MPSLETVEELAAYLANALGIEHHGRRLLPDDQGHADDCPCHQCWRGAMARRIRAAVATEAGLARLAQRVLGDHAPRPSTPRPADHLCTIIQLPPPEEMPT